MKIGVMYGSPEPPPAAMRSNSMLGPPRHPPHRRHQGTRRGVGNQTRRKGVKNKLAPPFKQVEFDIMYGEGYLQERRIIDLGVKAGVVEKSGAWFSYDSQRIGQGRENGKKFPQGQSRHRGKIEAAIRQNSGIIAEKILAGEQAEAAEEDDDAAEAKRGFAPAFAKPAFVLHPHSPPSLRGGRGGGSPSNA